MGPGTLLELRKHVDFRALSAIVISHYHLDHILDLGAFRYLAKYNPRPMAGRIPLLVPPGSARRFTSWATSFGDSGENTFLENVFDISEYDPGTGSMPGALTISYSRTVHPVPAWAMRVSGADSGDLGYTADTGPSSLESLSEFFAGVSLLISESTEPSDTLEPADKRGHLTPMEAGELAREAGASALILTHRWEELDLDRAAREAQAAFSGPVMIARPGLSAHL
jgi:ribonuclease BN (tRNA processing enzyme)